MTRQHEGKIQESKRVRYKFSQESSHENDKESWYFKTNDLDGEKREAGKHTSQKYQLVCEFFKKKPGKLNSRQ